MLPVTLSLSLFPFSVCFETTRTDARRSIRSSIPRGKNAGTRWTIEREKDAGKNDKWRLESYDRNEVTWTVVVLDTCACSSFLWFEKKKKVDGLRVVAGKYRGIHSDVWNEKVACGFVREREYIDYLNRQCFIQIHFFMEIYRTLMASEMRYLHHLDSQCFIMRS